MPAGINLNLDIWANGDINAARRHFNAQLATAFHILKEKGKIDSNIRMYVAVDIGLKLEMIKFITEDNKIAREIVLAEGSKASLGASAKVQVAHIINIHFPDSKL